MKVCEIIFSPTGGTEKVASIVASQLGGTAQIIDLSDRCGDFSNIIIDSDAVAVIAMPCFGGRIPKVAKNRLLQIEGNECKAVIVNVYGNRAFDDALLEQSDASREAGFEVMAAIAAIAEHSIMHQYAEGRPDTNDVKQLSDFGERIASHLVDNAACATPDIPGNRPYCKEGSVPLTPQIKGDCTKCGECAESCPVGAIDDAEFHADAEKCIACMRCIKICPVQVRKVNGLLVRTAALAIKKQESIVKENELYI